MDNVNGIALIRRFFLLAGTISFFSLQVSGSDTLLLDHHTRYPVFKYMQFYHDTSGTVSPETVMNLCIEGQFAPSGKMPERLLPGKTYWFHWVVKNVTKDSYSWMFNVNAPLSRVELYTVSPRDTLKVTQESVNNYHKIKIACNSRPGEVTEYYIRACQMNALDYSVVNSYISPQDSFIRAFIEQSTMTGLIIGVLLLMLIYNLFLYATNRKKVFLIYLFYIFFSIIFILHGSYLFEYVLFRQQQYRLVWLYITLSVGDLFYIWFIREFIEPANIPSGIDNYFYKPLFLIVILSTILLGVLAITDTFLFIRFYYFIPIMYALIGLVLAILLIIYVKRPEAKYTLIGNSIAITSGIISLYLDNSVRLENNHVYNIGLLVDIFFFTYALSLKIKRQDDLKHKDEMQLSLLKVTLAGKQRELAQKALYIKQQEEILATIKEQLLASGGEEKRPGEALDDIFSDMSNYLKQHSWDDFEKYFTEIHPGFNAELKRRANNLTQHELRICALIKLNLTIKQMAGIFHRTSKNIEDSYARIIQKFGLTDKETLADMLSEL
jgi:hypothetical protein